MWGLAFLLRCLYAWDISSTFLDLPRIGDAEAYHLWAQRIAGGDWLGQGVFYQAPLYPYFLAGIYFLFGDNAATVRFIQAAVGATSCTLVVLAASSWFARRKADDVDDRSWGVSVGALAGVGLAIYPPAIFHDLTLDKSCLVTFFTSALLVLLLPSPERMTNRRLLMSGSVLGLLALARENALLLAVPVLIWTWIGSSRGSTSTSINSVRSRIAAPLLFAAGFALVLFPVALRNYVVGGELHLTTAQLGPNLYIGNHRGATGTYEPLVAGHGSAVDEREDATRIAEQALGRTLTAGEVSRYWTDRALQDIRAQPGEWLALLGRKLALTFNVSEIADTDSYYVYAESSWVLRPLGPFNFAVLAGIAVVGIVLTAYDWRRLWLLYAIAGTYAISVVMFYVVARYRFPVVPILMMFAAASAQEMRVRFLVRSQPTSARRRDKLEPRGSTKVAFGVVAGIAVAAFAHLPLEDVRASRAAHYANVAAAYLRPNGSERLSSERVASAKRHYELALREMPELPAAKYGMGTLLAREGQPADAIPYYRAALSAWPEHAEARYNLGLALVATGQAREAADQYREALRLHPDDADTHIALGKALLLLEQPGVAIAHYEKGLALRPDDVTALVGLGVALAQTGRVEAAIAKYERALQLKPDNVEAHNNFGATLANQGRFAEALPHFERVVHLRPEDGNARKNLETLQRARK